MKAFSFLRGIGIALLLALASSVLFSVLTTLVGSASALRLVIAASGFAYLLYLLTHCPRLAGRITSIVLWCVAATGLWLLGPAIGLYLLVHVLLVWAARSIYRYAGALCALVDLGLSLVSLAVAVWAAQHTGSLFLSVWCLFLTQALFVFVPTKIGKRRNAPEAQSANPDRFARAQQAADAALRRLADI